MLTRTPAIAEAEDRRDVARAAMLDEIERSLAEVFGDRQATRLDSGKEFAAVKPGTLLAVYAPSKRASWASGPKTIPAVDALRYREKYEAHVTQRATPGGTLTLHRVYRYPLGDERIFSVEADENAVSRYRLTNARDLYDLGMTLDEFHAQIAEVSNRAEVERLATEYHEARAACDALTRAAREAEEAVRAPFARDADAINAALNGAQIAEIPTYGALGVEITVGRISFDILRAAMIGFATEGRTTQEIMNAGLTALARPGVRKQV